MGREVRMVPADWQHPKYPDDHFILRRQHGHLRAVAPRLQRRLGSQHGHGRQRAALRCRGHVRSTPNLDEHHMADEKLVQIRLKHGAKFPYDATDAWWQQTGEPVPPAAIDWAHAAARGVLADLMDRGGIKHGFNGIDENVRAEMVDSLAAIIRAANSQPQT